MRHTFAILCLSAWLSGWAMAGMRDLPEVTEGQRLPTPLKVVLAESGSGKPVRQEILIPIVQSALQWTRELAPTHLDHHFFSPPQHGYPDHEFALLLSTGEGFIIDGQRTQWPEGIDMQTMSLFHSSSTGRKEKIVLAVRVDHLIFNPDGSVRPNAAFLLTEGLLHFIYANWQEHLESPMDEIESLMRHRPAVVKERVLLRRQEVAKRLLATPERFKMRRSGDLLGILYAEWLKGQFALNAGLARPNGAMSLPTEIQWGPETVGRRAVRVQQQGEQVFFRALHLVSATPPPTAHLFSSEGLDGIDDRHFRLFLMDSDDRDRRQTPFINEGAGAGDSDLAMLLSGETVLASVLWSDLTIFDGKETLRKDALAQTALAMAAEIYGPVGHWLPQELPVAFAGAEGLTRKRWMATQAAMDFVDRLQKGPLWATLSDDEKQSFVSGRALYQTENAEWDKCSARLLGAPLSSVHLPQG